MPLEQFDIYAVRIRLWSKVRIFRTPQFDEETIRIDKNTVLETREALFRNTIPFNSTGLPAISIPIGLTKDNMPVAAQIIGRPFMEETILSMAYYHENTNNSSKIFVPPISSKI
jgi:aspartyl-tRNA(Asn)/glutamyl-tRNA(Gln) amidotransferase subunit A